MPPFRRISVVIANHNYGRFVGGAIDSALALDWDDVEVVVVDDGSTDSSREVIARYEDRVVAIYQENATQRVARNRGYERVTGDVVIHLDADDVLYPGIGSALARVWRPGLSKVQFQMLRIGEDGEALGSVFPRFRREPSPEQIRSWADLTTAYPTPPGSGNAYARAFLDRLFPLDDSCGPATDSALLAAAPFLGDVLTVAQPLVGYRVHGRNSSDLLRDPARFGGAVERARQRYEFAARIRGLPVDPGCAALRRSRSLLELRVAAARLRPDHPSLPGDSRRRLLWDAVRSPAHAGPESPLLRAGVLVWCTVTLLVPQATARSLVRMRFRHDRKPIHAVAGRLRGRRRTPTTSAPGL